MNKSILFLVIFSLVYLFCSGDEDTIGKYKYIQSIEDWHMQRIERLKKPDSWLSLAGLFWLEPGENRFGSSAENQIQFPENAAPKLGTLTLSGAEITYKNTAGAEVLYKESKINEIAIKTDQSGNPTILSYGSLKWYLIQRDKRFAIRLKDSKHPAFSKFTGIERYEVDPAWRIPAIFIPYNPSKKISIPNVLGTVEESNSPGAIKFEYQGHTNQLDVIGKPDAKQFFIIFSDMTSGNGTYGAGRFLYVEAPDEVGHTFIDFNKAYNPPCAFTEFATCPLPPRQNWLTIAITAGEKDYHINPYH